MNNTFYTIGGLRIKIQSVYSFPSPPHVSAFLSKEKDFDYKIEVLSDNYFNHNISRKKYKDADWFSVYEN